MMKTGSITSTANTEKTALFNTWYNKQFDNIKIMCLSKEVPASNVEDAMQSAAAKVWAGISSYKGESSFNTWAMAVVKNAILDYVRSNETRFHEPYPDHNIAGSVLSEYSLALEDYIDHLPDKYMKPVELYVEGYSNKEIGQILEISEEAVWKRIQRAKQKIKDLIKTEGEYELI